MDVLLRSSVEHAAIDFELEPSFLKLAHKADLESTL